MIDTSAIAAPPAGAAPHLNPFALLGLGYVALLGMRSLLRKESAGLGVSLLLTAAFGGMSTFGVEVDVPITVGADAADRHAVDIPLLRTLAELCAASAVAGLVVRAIDLLLTARQSEPLLRLQRSVIWLGLMIVGAGIIYEVHFVSNLPIRTALLSIGGASVFIIGLAMQSTLGNVFAGYGLHASNVFRKGDIVKLGKEGRVGRIYDSTLSTTRILTRDGEMLVLPHSILLQQEFYNLDHPTPALRELVKIGVSYDVPPAVVKDAAQQVLAAEPNVLRSPEPHVWLLDFGDSAVQYGLQFWIPDYDVRDETLDRVRTRLWYALHDAGIEIPFPIRTVRMSDRAEETQRMASAAARVEKASEALRACPMFDDASMNAAERRELARAATEVVLAAGDAVVRRGELSDAMYVVSEGACEVRLPSGDRVPLGAGSHFGEIALVMREARTADVVATAPRTALLRLPRESVLPVLSRRPEFSSRMSTVAEARRETTMGATKRVHRSRGREFIRSLVELLRPV